MGELCVLLVEDDADLRGLMRRHLSGRGYRIWEAANVAQALECLEHLLPDLLILDIGLPDGSGWQVARQVRSLMGVHVPIVVCSSHEPSLADIEGIQIQGYIPKPFDLRTLAERVDAALAAAGSGYEPILERPEADDRDVAFYSSLAHDMRTPMATLRTAIESLLADDVQWDEEARREFLDAIASSAERVSKYARDVIDLARLDAGAMRPHLQRIEPAETIEALTRALRARRPVPLLAVILPPEVPAAMGDPGFVHRILLDVVENAVRCSPPASEVTIEVLADGAEVVWCVSDDGPGVEPEERARVFDRYYRMRPGVRNASRGTRLSIYLCSELAGLQGGRMWADATEEGGARFCLALPIADEEAGEWPIS